MYISLFMSLLILACLFWIMTLTSCCAALTLFLVHVGEGETEEEKAVWNRYCKKCIGWFRNFFIMFMLANIFIYLVMEFV